jgi:hypothetical protein
VLTSSIPAEKTQKLTAEIANSRLAMMAIRSLVCSSGLPHQLRLPRAAFASRR